MYIITRHTKKSVIDARKYDVREVRASIDELAPYCRQTSANMTDVEGKQCELEDMVWRHVYHNETYKKNV
jgi:hypothetical protein